MSELSTENYTFVREELRYRVVDIDMGRLLVVGSSKGVCLTELDDDAAPSLEYMAKRFPQAVLKSADPLDDQFNDWTQAVADYIAVPNARWEAPLDVRGTEFQVSVWNQLLGIPFGQLTTYGDIAKALGKPTASRAVGKAVGENPIAIHIPCHRVIGKNGQLTGFRWGLKRKKIILLRENVDLPALRG